MRKLIFATFVVVLFCSSVIIYTEWEKKSFLKSLPEPPINMKTPEVEQPSRVDDLSPSDASHVVVPARTERQTTPLQQDPDDYDRRTNDDDRRTNDEVHQDHNPDPSISENLATDEHPMPAQNDMLKSLIERFGDIPQVHTHVEFHQIRSERDLTLDEEIVHLETTLFLFPNEATRKTLVLAKWEKANGFVLPTEADLEYFKSEGITVLYNEDGSLKKITTKY